MQEKRTRSKWRKLVDLFDDKVDVPELDATLTQFISEFQVCFLLSEPHHCFLRFSQLQATIIAEKNVRDILYWVKVCHPTTVVIAPNEMKSFRLRTIREQVLLLRSCKSRRPSY